MLVRRNYRIGNSTEIGIDTKREIRIQDRRIELRRVQQIMRVMI